MYFGKPQKVVFYGKGTGWMDGITELSKKAFEYSL